MTADENSPRVLLLKNYPSASATDKLMIESFTKHIQASVPDASLDICCIANGEEIPDLQTYRLIILSGGKVNLLEDDKPPWALRVLEMVRKTAAAQTGPKLLGICWGHQAVHYALGGKLAWVPDGPCIGVQDINLIDAGQEIFGSVVLKMHKFHVRYVSELASGFTSLAQDNEISMSESRRIWTFQGHPELTFDISKLLCESSDGPYKVSHPGEPTARSGAGKLHDIGTEHDGGAIWKLIMRWAMSP